MDKIEWLLNEGCICNNEGDSQSYRMFLDKAIGIDIARDILLDIIKTK